MDTISIVGLGKLGSCLAATLSFKEYKVIGVEKNKDVINAINNGIAPVIEPQLQNLINSSKDRLKATNNYEEVIEKTNISFFIVPTPSEANGNFSTKYLSSALKSLAVALNKNKKKYHLFVITSTIMPGTSEKVLIPIIEKYSNREVNKGFGFCYNPEFIALGSVISDLLNPDFVLIGESDKKAGKALTEIYKKICTNKVKFARMSIISAEIAKISLNSFITMKISFANTIANLCELIPGAEVDRITHAISLDRRVSPHYLKGGLGYGGPCFPRDNKAFAAFAEKYGVDAMQAKATDFINEKQATILVEKVIKYTSKSPHNKVSVIGLSYKPNTPVIEEAPAIKLIEELLNKGIQVIAYDPLSEHNAKAHFGEKVLFTETVGSCVAQAPVCVITGFYNEFKGINDNCFKYSPTTIIDCWRKLDTDVFKNKNINYVALGRYF